MESLGTVYGTPRFLRKHFEKRDFKQFRGISQSSSPIFFFFFSCNLIHYLHTIAYTWLLKAGWDYMNKVCLWSLNLFLYSIVCFMYSELNAILIALLSSGKVSLQKKCFLVYTVSLETLKRLVCHSKLGFLKSWKVVSAA